MNIDKIKKEENIISANSLALINGYVNESW